MGGAGVVSVGGGGRAEGTLTDEETEKSSRTAGPDGGFPRNGRRTGIEGSAPGYRTFLPCRRSWPWTDGEFLGCRC